MATAYTWIVDKTCDGPCDKKRKFDSDKSSTYQSDGGVFRLTFGVGNVSGILGRDTFILGDSKMGSIVKIPNTTFGQAQIISEKFGKLPLDGMFGLNFKKSGVDNVQPVFQVKNY